MTNNIMLEYIKITQKEILEYMKLIFGNQYSNKLALRYMDAYLNVRFYNFYPKDNNLPFRKNYLNAIKEEEASILRSMPEKQKLVEHMGLFFYYILYFDKISYKVDIDEMIEKLYKMRKKILGKDEQNFKDKFYNIYTSYLNEKEAFLKQLKTDEFFLKITDYEGVNNAHKVLLKYNIKVPEIYSGISIEKAFNTGIIAEDKLEVEYNLITLKVLDDILKGNFKRQYIVEFAISLIDKPKKMARILNIIDNSAVQDKVSLQIKYKDFMNNKDTIYDLMRNGFKFSVILDETFEPIYTNFEKLNIFQFTIGSKNLKYFDEIIANKPIIKKLIEI